MARPTSLSCCSAFAEPAIDAGGAPRTNILLIPMGTSTPKNGAPAKVILRDWENDDVNEQVGTLDEYRDFVKELRRRKHVGYRQVSRHDRK